MRALNQHAPIVSPMTVLRLPQRRNLMTSNPNPVVCFPTPICDEAQLPGVSRDFKPGGKKHRMRAIDTH